MTGRRFAITIAAAAIATTVVSYLPANPGAATVAGSLATLAVLMYQPNRKDGQ
ncbi:hypothetical protein ACWD25_15335 [Streptomyces sp. NPDC002920]